MLLLIIFEDELTGMTALARIGAHLQGTRTLGEGRSWSGSDPLLRNVRLLPANRPFGFQSV